MADPRQKLMHQRSIFASALNDSGFYQHVPGKPLVRQAHSLFAHILLFTDKTVHFFLVVLETTLCLLTTGHVIMRLSCLEEHAKNKLTIVFVRN